MPVTSTFEFKHEIGPAMDLVFVVQGMLKNIVRVQVVDSGVPLFIGTAIHSRPEIGVVSDIVGDRCTIRAGAKIRLSMPTSQTPGEARFVGQLVLDGKPSGFINLKIGQWMLDDHSDLGH
jgi:hypothetical protein